MRVVTSFRNAKLLTTCSETEVAGFLRRSGRSLAQLSNAGDGELTQRCFDCAPHRAKRIAHGKRGDLAKG